ncbi:ABC transporter permease [Patescibacteria group bacterium]|nr:ABC transporter permease [Patescibacteria group bacterium]
MEQFNAILAIAYRDFIKFTHDRPRILATFIFPVLFIGVLGSSLQSGFGPNIGYNFLTFTFTGVLAQTLFQSTAAGIISLIEDRENDFSQEMFVSPISRYAIIFGKILGESTIALTQGLGIVIFGLVIGVPISIHQIIALLPISLVVCLFGGSFGLLVLANLNSQRSANQIFPFIIFPQFFLAGVFNPIKNLPTVLSIMSHLAPMTYAVDFIRSIFYLNQPEYPQVVLLDPLYNLLILCGLFIIFTAIGTIMFVRNERNK